tara:strand:- start:264 stop:497 length:234 start_codon:yes stop_codon:yes gene_type:complete
MKLWNSFTNWLSGWPEPMMKREREEEFLFREEEVMSKKTAKVVEKNNPKKTNKVVEKKKPKKKTRTAKGKGNNVRHI